MLRDDVDASWTMEMLVQQNGRCTMLLLLVLEVPAIFDENDEKGCALCLPGGIVIGSKAAIAFVTVSFSPSEMVSASNTRLTSLSSTERQANYVLPKAIAHNVSHTPTVTKITTIETDTPPVSDQSPQWRDHTSRSHTHILRHHGRRRSKRFLPLPFLLRVALSRISWHRRHQTH